MRRWIVRRPLLAVLSLTLLGIFAASLLVPSRPAAAVSIPRQSLNISKHAYPNPVEEGAILFYEIKVENTGPVTLTTIAITDTIPAGAEQVWAAGACWVHYEEVLCRVDDVLPGSTTMVDFHLRVLAGESQIVNDQYAAGAPGLLPVSGPPVAVPVVTPIPRCTPAPYPAPTCPPGPGPTLGPTIVPTRGPTAEPDEPASPPPGTPHLILAQTVPPEIPAAGSEVILQAIVTNDGTGAARDVVLAVQVPAGLEVRDVTISPAAASEWTGSVLWVAWGYLEAGASASVELRTAVRPGGVGADEVVVGVPDYGLEIRASVGGAPTVLPPTGPGPAPWWGWLALAGALIAGGVFLLQYVRRQEPDRPASDKSP